VNFGSMKKGNTVFPLGCMRVEHRWIRESIYSTRMSKLLQIFQSLKIEEHFTYVFCLHNGKSTAVTGN